ncbi:MAG: hypothetical protein ACN4G0_13800 [Polyangiales bacterium]
MALVLTGILVGSVIAGPQASGADSHDDFRECVTYIPYAALGGRNEGYAKKSKALAENAIPIPKGWKVVGAAAQAGLLLCR